MTGSVHILVLRFSALGDVAMTIPVLQQLLEQHPQVRLTVVSQKMVAPLFATLPRTRFVGINPAKEYPGTAGLFRLFRRIQQEGPFDAIADLHQVLRTQVLRQFFQWKGYRTAKLHKGRAARKALTRQYQKRREPLQPVVEKYAQVFADLGFPIQLIRRKPVLAKPSLSATTQRYFAFHKRVIGFAPFAQHEAKRWNPEQSKLLTHALAEAGWQVLLLGAPGAEAHQLASWLDPALSIQVIAGVHSFEEELAIIAHLDTMISMDSANMHLAALYGVRVVSLWGATHPYAGFFGWELDPADIVQDEQLPCRPCSVFGNKACYRGDYACWRSITVSRVMDAVQRFPRT